MSSVGGEAQTSPPTLPLSERLARRLLRPATAEPHAPEAHAALAAHAYARLRAHLAVFLGEQGFDALWRRAIHLARRKFHTWGNAADAPDAPPLPPGLSGALPGDDHAEAEARLQAAFASFIALLFTFVGEQLGVRLIDQAWPDLPPDAADAPVEEPTQ